MQTFAEYQAAALRTWDPSLDEHQALALAGLGLAGESGEVADEIKKILFHDRPVNRDKLIEEAGDVLWYLAALCAGLKCTLGDLAHANNEKLKRRYPGGWPGGFPAAPAPVPKPVSEVKLVVVPADVVAAPAAAVVRAVVDIPTFVGPNDEVYNLKAGDVATVPVGIAKILTQRKKAEPVEATA